MRDHSLYRKGIKFVHITVPGTYVLHPTGESGVLRRVVVNEEFSTLIEIYNKGSAEIQDNPDLVASLDIGSGASFHRFFCYNLKLDNGLTVKSSGNADFTVIYE